MALLIIVYNVTANKNFKNIEEDIKPKSYNQLKKQITYAILDLLNTLQDLKNAIRKCNNDSNKRKILNCCLDHGIF